MDNDDNGPLTVAPLEHYMAAIEADARFTEAVAAEYALRFSLARRVFA